MMELAKLFQQALGAPIQVDGQELNAVLIKKADSVQDIQVRRISSTTDLVPGLCLQGKGVQFIVNDQVLKNLVLWADTSPDFVKIKVISKKKDGEIKFWNCWRDRQGVTQAWLGNAAMKVEEKNNTMKVYCNSGPSALAFNDLVLEITFSISGEPN